VDDEGLQNAWYLLSRCSLCGVAFVEGGCVARSMGSARVRPAVQ
jgi:hypothetical protein